MAYSIASTGEPQRELCVSECRTGLTLNASASFSSSNGGNNYAITYVANTTGVITPATLSYVAGANGMTYAAWCRP